MHGLLSRNINAGVHVCVRGADVSLRDVTIAQMGNGARECELRHAPEARGGFREFWKKSVELSWELDTEREGSTFGACRGQTKLRATGAARDGGAIIEKIVHLSCLCRNHQLKGNKRFRTWTKKSLRVFRVLGLLCSMYIYIYILRTFYVRFTYPYLATQQTVWI